MRILILVNEFPPGPGGVGTHAFEIARHLNEMGHSIVVVCEQHYASNEAKVDFNSSQSFFIYPYNQKALYVTRLFGRLSLFFKTVQKFNPEIVIASGSNSIWIASFYRIILRSYRLVVMAHGGELTFRPWVRKELTRWGCKIADHIIAVSNYTKKFIPKTALSKISVINNGADHSLFYDQNRRLELKNTYDFATKKILLTVGSVSERKGQDIVIRAMKTILQTHPNTIYLMAGRSNNVDFFKKIAYEEGVEESVFFLGAVNTKQLVDLYNMADLYVITSRHSKDGDFEGFGISVIEAALCGVPAIVTRNSGLIEAIEEGVTGISVSPENPKELAELAIQLLSQNLEAMGASAKYRASTRFTWAHIASLYHNLLVSLK